MTSNKVATLDVALRSLPKPKATVAFGLDSPLYFSGHSAIARLAPEGGAMVHVAKYLRSDETAGGDIERELEGLMEMMQPGWRTHVVFKQYLPNLMVTHAEATAAQGGLAGRPASRLPPFDNVLVAGDWVGPRGQLSDASAASAADAVAGVMAAAGPVDAELNHYEAQGRQSLEWVAKLNVVQPFRAAGRPLAGLKSA